MATFKDQLDNFRIKTLAQDVLQQPNSVGQLWDTLGLEVSGITAANFWDLTMRPLETNDLIMARIHGADDDSAILGEMRFLAAYCKLINPRKYASQLVGIMPDQSYAVADIADVNAMTSATSKTVSLLASSAVSDVYVFFDGKSTKGISVTISGTTKSFDATATYGDSLHFSGLSITSNSISLSITATSGDSSLANLHVVAITAAPAPSVTVDLTSDVTGVLPVANGGTGASSFPSINLASGVTGTLPVANGGTGLNALGTAGQVLAVNADADAAEWSTLG